jgi:hypothetical protein
LTGCVYPFAYRVEMAERPTILAGAFESLLAVVGLDDDIGFIPEATVRITDARGRPHRFVSPDPALRD